MNANAFRDLWTRVKVESSPGECNLRTFRSRVTIKHKMQKEVHTNLYLSHNRQNLAIALLP